MKFMNVAARYAAQPMYMVAASIGTNAYNLFIENAKPIVWIAIVVTGLVLAIKKEVTKIVVWLFIAILSVVMVYNVGGFTNKLLEIGNSILGL